MKYFNALVIFGSILALSACSLQGNKGKDQRDSLVQTQLQADPDEGTLRGYETCKVHKNNSTNAYEWENKSIHFFHAQGTLSFVYWGFLARAPGYPDACNGQDKASWEQISHSTGNHPGNSLTWRGVLLDAIANIMRTDEFRGRLSSSVEETRDSIMRVFQFGESDEVRDDGQDKNLKTELTRALEKTDEDERVRRVLTLVIAMVEKKWDYGNSYELFEFWKTNSEGQASNLNRFVKCEDGDRFSFYDSQKAAYRLFKGFYGSAFEMSNNPGGGQCFAVSNIYRGNSKEESNDRAISRIGGIAEDHWERNFEGKSDSQIRNTISRQLSHFYITALGVNSTPTSSFIVNEINEVLDATSDDRRKSKYKNVFKNAVRKILEVRPNRLTESGAMISHPQDGQGEGDDDDDDDDNDDSEGDDDDDDDDDNDDDSSTPELRNLRLQHVGGSDRVVSSNNCRISRQLSILGDNLPSNNRLRIEIYSGTKKVWGPGTVNDDDSSRAGIQITVQADLMQEDEWFQGDRNRGNHFIKIRDDRYQNARSNDVSFVKHEDCNNGGGGGEQPRVANLRIEHREFSRINECRYKAKYRVTWDGTQEELTRIQRQIHGRNPDVRNLPNFEAEKGDERWFEIHFDNDDTPRMRDGRVGFRAVDLNSGERSNIHWFDRIMGTDIADLYEDCSGDTPPPAEERVTAFGIHFDGWTQTTGGRAGCRWKARYFVKWDKNDSNPSAINGLRPKIKGKRETALPTFNATQNQTRNGYWGIYRDFHIWFDDGGTTPPVEGGDRNGMIGFQVTGNHEGQGLNSGTAWHGSVGGKTVREMFDDCGHPAFD